MMLMNDSGNESEERLESLFFEKLEKGNDFLAEVLVDSRLDVATGSQVLKLPPFQHNNSDSDAESDIYSKVNEFDVVFCDPKDKPSTEPTAELAVDGPTTADSEKAEPRRDNRRVLTSDNSTDSYASSIVNSSLSDRSTTAPEDDGRPGSNQKLTQINTCKILQRKLELKVERAKRNYRQMYEEQDFTPDATAKSAPLIPISRLPIPGGAIPRDAQQPLVDVNSPRGSNSDEDDLEQVSFFPRAAASRKAAARQELSDTFSIQEMTIESDQEDELDFAQCRKLSNSKGYKKILNRGLSAEDGEYLDNNTVDFDDDFDDSQNLELLPPKTGYNLREWAQRALCCFRRNDFLS